MTLAAATTYDVYVKSGEDWTAEPRLALEELSLNVFPEVPICRLRCILSNIGVSSARFGMEEALAAFPIDTEVLVVTHVAGDEPGSPTGACMFWGRVTGPTPTWGRKDESVTLVCRHTGALLGDFFVIGSHGRAYGDYSIDGSPVVSQQTHFTGLAAIVNPDHYGNMTVAPYTPGEDEVCRLFGPEGHLSLCTSWTSKKFLQYLMYWAVQASADIVANITFPDIATLGEGDLEDTPADFAADGLSYLEAMHRLLERAGWRGRMETGGTGTSPTASMAIWQIGQGTERTLVLGIVGEKVAAGDNAQQGSLTLDASGIVTTPRVVGGPVIVEGTFRLYPAWRAADLDTTCSGDPNADLDDPATWSETYYQRYVYDSRASLFSAYSTVGRKWALNEMADYIGEAYGEQPAWSPGASVGEGVGVWCMRSRPFTKPISRDAQGRSLSVLVEVTFDQGAHWQPLDAQVLDDEAAIIINARDLSTIKPAAEIESDYNDFWEALCEMGSAEYEYLRVRITACLADDSALEPSTPLTVPAWAKVQRATEFPYDRRKQYAKRIRLSTGDCASRFVADGYGADTRNDQAALTTEALILQAVTACIAVRGPVELFGTAWPYRPGDVITKIAGREISLAQSSGETPVYCEVVAVTIRAMASQSMEVVLEDARTRLGPGGVSGGKP